MNHYKITVKQLVKDNELDHDDKLENIPGEYDYWNKTEDGALDHFHETVAIACLDDFEITVSEVKSENQD